MIFKLRNSSLLKKAVAFSFLLQLAFLFMPIIIYAEIGVVPRVSGLGDANLTEIIINIVQLFLSFLGLIALVIIIYAGFIWMTSGGNQTKIDKAKGIMKSGLIGLLIILASYAIATFVVGTLLNITNPSGDGDHNNSYTDMTGGGFGEGALGGGVIESHYPERDQQNVSRNTMIMVSFKIPVATSTIITNISDTGVCARYSTNGNVCGKLKNIQITDGGSLISTSDVIIVLSANGKSILIHPANLLGSSNHNTPIIVHLMPEIQSSDNRPIFGNLADGYSWGFEVSTFSDTTPPVVVSVRPEQDTSIARNIIIAVNFSEPINVLSFVGNIIPSLSSDTTPLPGELKISNRYKTVEFLSSGSCGGAETINSCGEQVFCLPASAEIKVLVKSGDLINFDSGINDASGNYLDGNKNKTSEGTPTDDYTWNFRTTANVDLDAPRITSVSPNTGSETVQINSPVFATFDKELSSSSINSDNFYIYKFGDSCGDYDKKESIPSSCFPNYTTYLDSDNDKISSMHIYSPYLNKNVTYRPRLTSEIRDIFGNCFNPSVGPEGDNGQY